ncbi:MAG: Hsp70 family protein, partial [Myxococcales bacterium]
MPDAPQKPLTLRIRLPYVGEEEFLARFGPNLARGGVTIATASPKPVGSRATLEFVGSDEALLFRAQGQVVRAQQPGPEGKGGMTLRFTRLDGRSRALLDRAVALRDGTAAAQPPVAPPEELKASPEAQERVRRRMSLLEGAASGPGGTPQGPEPVLGIDLGTTNCRAAVVHDGRARMIALEGRHTALPSVIAFDDKGRMLLGTRAKAQLLVDPKSAIYGAKRLIGRRFRSERLRSIASHFPYEICADGSGDAAVRIQGRVVRVPEIASWLLSEIRNR